MHKPVATVKVDLLNRLTPDEDMRSGVMNATSIGSEYAQIDFLYGAKIDGRGYAVVEQVNARDPKDHLEKLTDAELVAHGLFEYRTNRTAPCRLVVPVYTEEHRQEAIAFEHYPQNVLDLPLVESGYVNESFNWPDPGAHQRCWQRVFVAQCVAPGLDGMPTPEDTKAFMRVVGKLYQRELLGYGRYLAFATTVTPDEVTGHRRAILVFCGLTDRASHTEINQAVGADICCAETCIPANWKPADLRL